MVKNLRKGSKVFWKQLAFPGEKKPKNRFRIMKGVVVKKFTARKGSVDVDLKNKEARTLVHVKAPGGIYSMRPSELNRNLDRAINKGIKGGKK